MKQKRVAIYCRVSTLNEMQEGSFEVQRDALLRRIAADEKLLLAGVYGDHGRSGRSARLRPEFMRLMRDCEEGRIDVIFTKSVSRFARNLADCVQSVRRLHELGVTVYFEREGLDTSDQSSEFLLSILAVVAQEESNALSQNMNWARRRYNESGMPYGQVPYGYRATGANHVWSIEESEAERVRLAFELAARGTPYKQIRGRLQEMELAEGTGKVWKQSVLLYLLTNVFYTGDYYTNKTCVCESLFDRTRVRNRGQRSRYHIEEHHPPLVSRPVYDRVQLLIQGHLLFSHKTRYTGEEQELLAAGDT